MSGLVGVNRNNKSSVGPQPPPPAPPPLPPRLQQPQQRISQQQTHVSEGEEDEQGATTIASNGPLLETNSLERGPYAPLAGLRRQVELEASNIIPLPAHVLGGLRDQAEKTKQCNCRRSNCLKLYCECFSAGIECQGDCNCVSCFNDSDPHHNEPRRAAIMSTLERNPHAFRPRAPAHIEGALPMASAPPASTAVASGKSSGTIKTKSKNSSSPAKKATKTKVATSSHHDTNVLWSQNLKSDSNSPKKKAAIATSPSKKGGVDALLASVGDRQFGCSCKKSLCLKKYCECFSAEACCTHRCRCGNCQNWQGNPTREKVLLKERKKAERKPKGPSNPSLMRNPSQQQPGTNSELPIAGGRSSIGGKADASNNKQGRVEKSSDKDGSSVVSGGINVTSYSAFWPPSFYAAPMKLGGRVPFAALAFGKSHRSMRSANDTDRDNSNSAQQGRQNAAPRRSITPTPASHSNHVNRNDGVGGTVLERRWKQQLTTVRETFDGIRSLLFEPPSKKQRRDTRDVAAGHDDKTRANRFSTNLLGSVANDLSSILDHVRGAEEAFRDPVLIEEVERENELLRQDDDDDKEGMALLMCTDSFETGASGMPMEVQVDMDEEELMLCHEELPLTNEARPNDDYETSPLPKELSGDESGGKEEGEATSSLLECTETVEELEYTASANDASFRREQALQVAQDVALIQELTRLVRQKTLELTRRRVASTS